MTAMVAPLKAPAMPPMPTTEPTARRGNMSEAMVKIFADHPRCAAAASPTKPTATQRLFTFAAKIIGVTASAQTSIVVLRAALIDQPRLMRVEDSQPPPILPT